MMLRTLPTYWTCTTPLECGGKRSATPLCLRTTTSTARRRTPRKVRRGRASLVPLRKSGVALRLPPHSRAALPHVRPHRTTGLKGRNIIAQGKGADRRPPPWVATHPPPWERRHSCRRLSRKYTVAAASNFSGVRGQAKRDTALFADDNERSEAADTAGPRCRLSPCGKAVSRFACPRPVIRPGRDTPEARIPARRTLRPRT